MNKPINLQEILNDKIYFGITESLDSQVRGSVRMHIIELFREIIKYRYWDYVDSQIKEELDVKKA